MSDYAKKNVEHFDKRAASYDSPLKLALAKKCTDAFLEVEGVNWDPNSTKVIDFACGTGLISLNLLSSAKEIFGLDTSKGMVEVYNQKAEKEGVAEKMKGRTIDVLSLTEEEVPEGLKEADVVVCSMAYHHIEDIEHTSRVLASLLKKGGHLFVVDLMQNDVSATFHNHGEPKDSHGHDQGHHHRHHHSHEHGGHGHGHEHNEADGHTNKSVKETIPHIGGMPKELLESTFQATGLLENVSAKQAFTGVKVGTEFAFVLATGTRK